MDIRIEQANFDDAGHAEAIVQVLDSYASDPIGGGEPLASEVRVRLVPALKRQSNALVLLAFGKRRPIGIAVCFYGLSTFKALPLLNIHDLAVIPAERGRGVGRALLGAAERHARARGCCKLTLEVQDNNEVAHGLYTSFGFRDYVLNDAGLTRFLEKPLI